MHAYITMISVFIRRYACMYTCVCKKYDTHACMHTLPWLVSSSEGTHVCIFVKMCLYVFLFSTTVCVLFCFYYTVADYCLHQKVCIRACMFFFGGEACADLHTIMIHTCNINIYIYIYIYISTHLILRCTHFVHAGAYIYTRIDIHTS